MTELASHPRLVRYAELVASSPHNLVSARDRTQLLSRHIPECVAFATMLPAGPARVLDVGSGGGLPGLVVAMLRDDLEVHLLDATRKKTTFLADTAHLFDVRATIHTGRAEELASGPLAGSFDLVTVRAVAPLDRLVAWTVPFLRPGGQLYAIKGARWADELAHAGAALRRCGAHVVATPGTDAIDTDHEAVGPRVVIIGRDR